MKLYATVSSERATKGQGGNEELKINIKGEKIEGIPTRTDLFEIVLIVNDNNTLEAFVRDYENDDTITLYPRHVSEPPKGKKQKGEECKFCKSKSLSHFVNMTICDNCKKHQ